MNTYVQIVLGAVISAVMGMTLMSPLPAAADRTVQRCPADDPCVKYYNPDPAKRAFGNGNLGKKNPSFSYTQPARRMLIRKLKKRNVIARSSTVAARTSSDYNDWESYRYNTTRRQTCLANVTSFMAQNRGYVDNCVARKTFTKPEKFIIFCGGLVVIAVYSGGTAAAAASGAAASCAWDRLFGNWAD